MVEEIVKKVLTTKTPSLPMDRVMVYSVEQVEHEYDIELIKCLLQLQVTQVDDATRRIEELGRNEKQNQQVTQKDPEFNELPKHLKCVFLSDNPLQLVIISNSLSKLEEEQFLRVLRNNKKAFG